MFIGVLLIFSGCGSAENTNIQPQINPGKPVPTIKIQDNSILTGGTGHLNGQELTVISYRVENQDSNQILRALSCSIYNSHNNLIESNTIDYSFLQSGSTWLTAGCTNSILKVNASGTYTVKAQATDVDGVKSNIATATFSF